MYGNCAGAIQNMLDYAFICGRKTHTILARIDPVQAKESFESFFFGDKTVMIPV